jgi:hypothetical protein
MQDRPRDDNGRSVTLAAVVAAVLLGFAGQGVAQEAAVGYEKTLAKYQITYNWQTHPAFPSAYEGPNSLVPYGEDMYTFSATAFWGMRLWQGGELYINPEVVSGVPFSGDLIGLGGFTNGEITRAGGRVPKLYLQRLFLRQTWNLGGGTEQVESGFNQMAGTVDRNRIVLTIGNFSTLDVFDGNAYAKDPRIQFMNWGNWTYSAYDYAADARGFGWGFAVEIYRGDWAFRFGRMTGPTEPNLLPVDFDILKHYGDQVEIQHNHTLMGQPGTVRVLAYRDRAVLASFRDATAYLLDNPGTDPQTIFDVRDGIKTKYGVGINIEQAINKDIGFFLRAMKSDGRTETYAFTEVDESLSTGLLIEGRGWNRADDLVGLSFMRNGLSSERRRYLEVGGISYFIGDGALQYKPETIFEGFYSLNLFKGVWITPDYQRIENPAYNSSRGPVNVFALRFHAEF